MQPPRAPSPPKSPLPARTLALVRPPTLPRGFTGVVACLRTPELVEVDWEMPVGTMSIGMVSSPGLSSISSSRVVKDDTTGLVYLDTIMTFIGRMVLGSLEPSEGPSIEGHNRSVIRTFNKPAVRVEGAVIHLHTVKFP